MSTGALDQSARFGILTENPIPKKEHPFLKEHPSVIRSTGKCGVPS